MVWNEKKTYIIPVHFTNLKKLISLIESDLYNALTIHGLARQEKLPDSVLDIQQFWKKMSYNVAGHNYSLDDIEHGILRGKF